MTGERRSLLSRRELLLGSALSVIGPRSVKPQVSRPNFVIILADDLGHGDLGITGCRDIRTPNIDSIGYQGVYFTHAYANGPVCSPTRAALLTGMYQQRVGVEGVLYADQRDVGMPLEALCLPEVLKPLGYATAIYGKWHLGYPKKFFPTRQGFDEFIGFVAGNIDYFAHVDRLHNPDLWHNEEPLKDDRYMTQLIADEAIRFLDEHRQENFLLYLPFNAPHDPFQGPDDRDTAGKDEITRKKNRNRNYYRKMVEALDHHIGRVLNHLEKTGLAESTVVFFMSDNGGIPGVASNAPFRGYKSTLWEGGIRTPLLIRWKGQIRPGIKRRFPCAGMDIFATCVELAGAKLPAGHKIDGRSLWPVIQEEPAESDRELWFHYKPPNRPLQKALVKSGWKYLSDERGEEHLFHLAVDVGERQDLKSQRQELFQQLKQRWEAIDRDVKASALPLGHGEPL